MQRLILDANILINYCSLKEETNKKVKEIFNKLDKKDVIIFLPDLAFYEFIYNLKKQNQSENGLFF